MPNVLRYFPTQALNFAFKDQFKRMFAVPKSDPYWKKMAANIVSGGLAGTVSLSFVYSLDYARTRLANDAKSSKKGGGEREFNGLADVFKKTLASDGIAGLYRGFVISAVGIFSAWPSVVVARGGHETRGAPAARDHPPPSFSSVTTSLPPTAPQPQPPCSLPRPVLWHVRLLQAPAGRL